MKQFGIGVVVVVLLIAGGAWLTNSLEGGDETVISNRGIHRHPQVEIYIQGEKQDIPTGIGLVGKHNPIHTHDDDGIIHLEFSGTVRDDDTRLENFFRVWGKTFNSEQIFEYENGPEGVVSMTVNGEPNLEFENYLMQDGDLIEIRYE